MSKMFERLKRLYDTGRIDIEELDNAVDIGWITEEERDMIIGENAPREEEPEEE